MANVSARSNCNCPKDCDSNYYTYSVSSTKLEIEKECQSLASSLSKQEFSEPRMLMRNFETMVLGIDTGSFEICKRALETMAYVKFQLSGENIMHFKRELRVTLADKVASFGGTVGLFTGMSILSFCEIIFWVLRALLLGLGADGGK